MTANSLVSANCKALNCESSSSRSFADGQEAGFKTDTREPCWSRGIKIAVIIVAPAVKYSFVSKGMQTRRTGQHKAKLTLSPRLHVKPLITVITTIGIRFLKKSYKSPLSHF